MDCTSLRVRGAGDGMPGGAVRLTHVVSVDHAFYYVEGLGDGGGKVMGSIVGICGELGGTAGIRRPYIFGASSYFSAAIGTPSALRPISGCKCVSAPLTPEHPSSTPLTGSAGCAGSSDHMNALVGRGSAPSV